LATDATFTRDGVTLRYRDYGSFPGSGTRVLLLPAAGFSAAMFDELAALLAPRHVVALDPRGSGRSDFPHTGYDYATLVADVLGLMDHLGWEKAAVGGSSTGAWIALNTAARAPERVESLMLLDGGFFNHSVIPGSTFERFAKPVEIPASAWDSADAMFEYLQSLAGDRKITTEAFRRAVYDTFLLDEGGRVINRDPDNVVQQAWSRLLWDSRIEGALASVRCQTLILLATKGTGIKIIDVWWAKCAKEAAKRLSRAKVVKVPGSHLLVFDALHETARAMTSFLPA
jgi:pimeloyl-ACP methyl ester carboxylesterase